MDTQPVIEDNNIYAAIGAGNISQALLIKLSSGSLSSGLMRMDGSQLSDADKSKEDQLKSIDKLIQHIYMQEQLQAYQASYDQTYTLVHSELLKAQTRVDQHTAHLTGAEKEDLFESLDDAIDHPENTEIQAGYAMKAIDYGVDGAALMVDQQSVNELSDMVIKLEQLNPETTDASNIHEETTQVISEMREDASRSADNREENTLSVQDRLNAAMAEHNPAQDRSSVASRVDSPDQKVSAQNDFNTGAAGQGADLDVSIPDQKVVADNSFTP